jgi:signal peptidase I
MEEQPAGHLISPGEVMTQPVFVQPASRKASIIKQFFSLLCLFVLAFGSYFGVSHFLVQSVKVIGVSMVPTLHDSQNYLLNRWIYYTRGPKRSEIVVLRDPSDNGFSVKRVIATAGDSVFLKDGNIYINGRELNEPYLRPGTFTDTGERYRDKLIVCGNGQFFVLGDNRMNSIDSRFYGPVPRQNILGMIVP